MPSTENLIVCTAQNHSESISEKSIVECSCGSIIHASHVLKPDGELLGNEHCKSMTALDMHIWYECELVRSNCKTCG